jgi:uncharacterized membrane protein
MKYNSRGSQLISEMLTNSEEFYKKGKSYQLLQEYFDGFPIETLKPLLNSSNNFIQRSVAWIVSELGVEASGMIRDIVKLLDVDDQFVRYHALESIMICSFGEKVNEFINVIHSLEADNGVIRVHAMTLISNANSLQLNAAIHSLTDHSETKESHLEGLSALLKADSLNPEFILNMIMHIDSVKRKYGAILAKKLMQKFPKLIFHVAMSEDTDLRNFYQEAVDIDSV